MKVRRLFGLLIGLLLIVVTAAGGAAAQRSRTLQGTVVDSAGLPIQGARIEFQSASGETRLAASDSQGGFSFADVSGGGTLFVSYPGFAAAMLDVGADFPGDHLDVRLAPSSADERIVVSAAETDRVPAEPSSQYVVSQQDVQTAGSLSLDDILRQAPGFELYRREGSLFANPTSQGVSLRGVGSNGASRAAVLLDGIPINDPFGGWVFVFCCHGGF